MICFSHCSWCRICQRFRKPVITWMNSNHCGASTSSALVGHGGHAWRATWAFETEVRCGRRVKTLSSASGVALLATFHPSAAHVLVLFEQSLVHCISVVLVEPPLFGCLLFLYCSLASTRQLLKWRGKEEAMCHSCAALWEMELLLFKALCGFCFFMWRWEEVVWSCARFPAVFSLFPSQNEVVSNNQNIWLLSSCHLLLRQAWHCPGMWHAFFPVTHPVPPLLPT